MQARDGFLRSGFPLPSSGTISLREGKTRSLYGPPSQVVCTPVVLVAGSCSGIIRSLKFTERSSDIVLESNETGVAATMKLITISEFIYFIKLR